MYRKDSLFLSPKKMFQDVWAEGIGLFWNASITFKFYFSHVLNQSQVATWIQGSEEAASLKVSVLIFQTKDFNTRFLLSLVSL
jgi:ABC-type cobalamin transport system permease subunit